MSKFKIGDGEAPEQESAPKGHPHAALMAEYAKDAAETDKPWKRWQYRCRGNDKWSDLGAGNPGWFLDTEYRRKPVEKWANLYSRVAGGMSVVSACGYDAGGYLYDTEDAARKCASPGKNGYIGTFKIEVPAE